MAGSSQSTFSMYGHINRRSQRHAHFRVTDSPTPSPPEADVSHAPIFRQGMRLPSRDSLYATPRQLNKAVAVTPQNEESLFVPSSQPKHQFASSSAQSSTMHRMKFPSRQALRSDDSSSSQAEEAEEVDVEDDLDLKVRPRGTGFARAVLYGNTMAPFPAPVQVPVPESVPEPAKEAITPEPTEVYGEEHRDFYLKTKRSLRGRVTTDRIYPGSKAHVPSRDNYYEPCTLEQATVKENPMRPVTVTRLLSSRESSLEPTPKRRHLLRATPKISYKLPPLLDSDLEDSVVPPSTAGSYQAKRSLAKGKAHAARSRMGMASPTDQSMSKAHATSFDLSNKTDTEIQHLLTAWTSRLIRSNASHTTQNASLMTQNASLTTQNASLTAQTAHLTAQTARLSAQNTALQSAQTQLSALESELAQLRSQASAGSSELHETRDKLATATGDLAVERTRANSNLAKIVRLNEQISGLSRRNIADREAAGAELEALRRGGVGEGGRQGGVTVSAAPVARMSAASGIAEGGTGSPSGLRARLLEGPAPAKREEEAGAGNPVRADGVGKRVDSRELMEAATRVVDVAAPLMGAHMGLIGERLAALKSVVQGLKREV